MIPDPSCTGNGDLSLSTFYLEYRDTTLTVSYKKLRENNYFMSAQIKGTDKFPIYPLNIKGETSDSLETFIEEYKKIIDVLKCEIYHNS